MASHLINNFGQSYSIKTKLPNNPQPNVVYKKEILKTFKYTVLL